MGTIVSFHAHPDDESIATGGTMALASDEGHRVVLVVATAATLGELARRLGEGEQLTDRRRAEMFASAEVIGVHRVEFLGWTDSGMIGDHQRRPRCFWQADVDQAAGRLADLLPTSTPT